MPHDKCVLSIELTSVVLYNRLVKEGGLSSMQGEPELESPSSAITASPASNKFSSPLCFTISLSLIEPVHSGGMKERTPVGVIPTNNLAAFQWL